MINSLEPTLRRELEVAYRRTSRLIEETQQDGWEQAWSGAVRKLSLGAKRTGSRATKEGMLPYSESAVEDDLTDIVKQLKTGKALNECRAFVVKKRRADNPKVRVHVIVVLDELDKLRGPDGKRWIRELLEGSKTILTERGMSFVLVGGERLHRQLMAGRARPTDRFAPGWHLYVPCLWDVEDELLDHLITDEQERQSVHAEVLRDHLAYCARGVPRLLLLELHRLVTEGPRGHFYIDLSGSTLKRVEQGARLQSIVKEHRFKSTSGNLLDSDQREIDLERSAVTELVALIARRETAFTVDEILQESASTRLKECRDAGDIVGEVILRMERHQLIEAAPGRAAAAATYRVKTEAVEDVSALVADEPVHLRSEQAYVRAWPARLQRSNDATPTLHRGRYRVDRRLAETATGHVYRCLDTQLHEEVAVQIFDVSPAWPSRLVQRSFMNAGRRARQLRHQYVVEIREVFVEPDVGWGVARDLLEGESLMHRVAADGPLDARSALAVTWRILEAVHYLSSCGLTSLDLTSDGVMTDRRLVPTLTQVGLEKYARRAVRHAARNDGATASRPFTAPEELGGSHGDVRSDIYSVGCVLCHMLTGTAPQSDRPNGASDRSEAIEAIEGSNQLRAFVYDATTADRERRFRSPTEMMANLRALPEVL